MPKFRRLVVPGHPHHVTQRGVRKQRTFFSDSDYQIYMNILARLKPESGVKILSYCLMPNHVHIVAVPSDQNGLAKLFGVAHQRYAKRTNADNGWCGHLWQERFHSVVMDERHTLAAIRYVELNPVRAGLCNRADDWAWSSVHKHLSGRPDELTDECALTQKIADWWQFLNEGNDSNVIESLRASTTIGRPLGDPNFVELLELKTGRRIRPRRPGRPRSK